VTSAAIGTASGLALGGAAKLVGPATKSLEGVFDTGTIKFTQDTLGRNINGIASFKDGRPIQGMIDKFKAAGRYTDDVAPIRVFERNGVIQTLDNRRLFAAHQAGVKARTVPATAKEVAKESFKFTNPGDGTYIGVKGALK
jgi:filamentous hemagglutinin